MDQEGVCGCRVRGMGLQVCTGTAIHRLATPRSWCGGHSARCPVRRVCHPRWCSLEAVTEYSRSMHRNQHQVGTLRLEGEVGWDRLECCRGGRKGGSGWSEVTGLSLVHEAKQGCNLLTCFLVTFVSFVFRRWRFTQVCPTMNKTEGRRANMQKNACQIPHWPM